jgi:hypothetical protein
MRSTKITTAVHGSWKVSPPSAITPSQKDASFSMQDPSMAAAGYSNHDYQFQLQNILRIIRDEKY